MILIAPRAGQGPKSKFWCFTINNPELFMIPQRDQFTGYDYIIMGTEFGHLGTRHFQGFIMFTDRKYLTGVKKQHATAHWEIMRGNSEQARDYCKKEETYVQDGDWYFADSETRGGGKLKRDYNRLIDLSEEHDFKTIREEMPDTYWNHYHTMHRIAADNPKKIKDLKKTDNEWIWGKPGVGKSYLARDENVDFYDKGLNKWWTGYKNESAVIVDDVDLSHATWIGAFLKRWGDRYSFPADVHGSRVDIRPQRIIVTSNYSIEQMFPDEALQVAIKRRFRSRNIQVLEPNDVTVVNRDIPGDSPDAPWRRQRIELSLL